MNTDQKQVYNALRSELEHENSLHLPQEESLRYGFEDKALTLPQILQEMEAETLTGKNIVKALEEKGRKGLYAMIQRDTYIQGDLENDLLTVPFKDFCETLITRMRAPHAPSGFLVPLHSKIYTWKGALREAAQGDCDELFTMMYCGALGEYEIQEETIHDRQSISP